MRWLIVLTALCVLATAISVAMLVWYRNHQIDIIREQIREGYCDLLDEMPAGGLLDRPRAKYGCGPGYPLSDIDREQQREQGEIVQPPAPSAPSIPPAVVPDGPRSMNLTDRE